MEQLTLEPLTRTFTCGECGEEKPQRTGTGRPWKVCRTCVKRERVELPCDLCGKKQWRRVANGATYARCSTCSYRVWSAGMTEYRRTLRRMKGEAKKRQRLRARFIYLEARCRTCGHPMWLDARAVAKGQRQCSTMNCSNVERAKRDVYRDGIAAKNHKRRLAGKQGEDVRKSVVWERDGGICHICEQPADPKDWHLEHRVPLSRGGEHTYANVAVSHPACNLAKGTQAA